MTATLDEVKPYLSEDAVADVRELDKATRSLIAEQLHMLPVLEGEGGARIVDASRNYRALALPNGYRVIYRPLSEIEVKEVEGRPSGPGYLVIAIKAPAR